MVTLAGRIILPFFVPTSPDRALTGLSCPFWRTPWMSTQYKLLLNHSGSPQIWQTQTVDPAGGALLIQIQPQNFVSFSRETVSPPPKSSDSNYLEVQSKDQSLPYICVAHEGRVEDCQIKQLMSSPWGGAGPEIGQSKVIRCGPLVGNLRRNGLFHTGPLHRRAPGHQMA